MTAEQTSSGRLSWIEKIGYGLGDTATNFVYASVTILLGYFYTDVYGLSAATVATILLVVRIVDAVTDPLMGSLCERTQTRSGKYRPYILWVCVPFAVASVLVFTVPDLQGAVRVVYAYVTYIVLMILFTAINIPYGAMTGVMTDSPSERASLNSVRFVMASLGALIVSSSVIPMTELWPDPAIGYRYAMIIMAVVSVILFLICFLTTKERVIPVKRPGVGESTLKSIALVWRNDQYRWVALITLVMVTAQTVKGTGQLFYINSVVEGGKNWATEFLVAFTFGGMLGASLSSTLIRNVDKKKAWIGLHLILVVISSAAYFADQNIALVLSIQFLSGFFTTMIAPIWFTYTPDAVDYGEIKFGKRLDALSLSFTIFSLKLGLSIGGALCLFLLGLYGYQSGGVEQTAESINGISIVFSFFPAAGFLLTAYLISFVKLDSKTIESQAKQLQALRAAESAAN